MRADQLTAVEEGEQAGTPVSAAAAATGGGRAAPWACVKAV